MCLEKVSSLLMILTQIMFLAQDFIHSSKVISKLSDGKMSNRLNKSFLHMQSKQ